MAISVAATRPQQRDRHRPLAAQAVVEEAHGVGAGPRRHVEHDAEDQDVLGGEAEGAGGVDAAEGEDGHQGVVVEQAGDEEADDLPVLAHLGEGVDELAGRLGDDHPAAAAGDPRLVLLHPEEDRHAEHREPGRHQQVGGADVLARRAAEAEPGLGRLDEAVERQDQGEEAAEVAQCPAVAGDPAHPLRRRHVGEEGVVEHHPQLEADVGDHQPGERRPHLRRGGRSRAPPCRRWRWRWWRGETPCGSRRGRPARPRAATAPPPPAPSPSPPATRARCRRSGRGPPPG